MRVSMLLAAAAVTAALIPAAASAQNIPEITIRPRGDGFGGSAYVGPYGRSLPGVQMFAGRPFGIVETQVKLPTRTRLINEQTRIGPIGIRDAWHGTLSPGIPIDFRSFR